MLPSANKIDKMIWKTIEVSGDIPSPRWTASIWNVDDAGFYIFGGRNERTVFDELYYFDIGKEQYRGIKYFREVLLDRVENQRSPSPC